MTIHPIYAQQAVDTTQEAGEATAYDSIWANTGVPEHQPTGLEQIMLSHDKLYVVLAVVLIIWFGIAFLLFRTDRKLAAVERSIEDRIPDDEDTL